MAQSAGTGVYPFGAYDNRGFDTINLGNLNIHFSIPIVSRAGRGLNFEYNLDYEGQVWSAGSANGATQWQPASGWGFQALSNSGGIGGYVVGTFSHAGCPRDPDGTSGVGTRISNLVYHDPFGQNHALNITGLWCSNRGWVTTSGDGTTSDGSGYTYDLVHDTLYDRAGHSLEHVYPWNSSSPPDETVKDTNGNVITSNPDGTFTDTLGVTALKTTGAGTASSPTVFTYPVSLQADNANTAAVTVSYRTYTVQTNFQCSGINEYPATSVDLIDTITYADSPSNKYQFTYETTPGNGSAVTGRIKSVTLPTFGVITYTYSDGCNGSGMNSDGSVATLTRSVSYPAASKVYSHSVSSTTSSSTNVTDELSHSSTYTFLSNTDGRWYPLSEKFYEGGASGTPLLERTLTYNFLPPGTQITGPITRIDQAESYNGSARFYQVNDYTSGLITEILRYDPADLSHAIQWTRFTYGANGKISEIDTYDGNNTLASQIKNGFDESALNPTSGLPGRTDAASVRGNLTSTSIWAGGTNYLKSSYTYNDTGTISSITQPEGTTNYGYDSGTQAFVTSSVLPTPTSGVTETTSATFDIPSASVTSTTGANAGQTTSITQYDRLMRPLITTTPTGGVVTMSYTPNLMTRVVKIDNNSSSNQQQLNDSFGRLARTMIYNGFKWYITDYCYNLTGQLQFRSMPWLADTASSGPQHCSQSNADQYSYDGLGRLTSVNHVDGSYVHYAYNAGATQETHSAPNRTTITQRNTLGFITGVCELSNNTQMPGSGSPQNCGMDISGSGFLTSYSYDSANHKTTITQGAQTRVFQTDAAGRAIRISEPESGETQISYAYDTTGLQITRVKPKANQFDSNVHTTSHIQFDALGRIVSVDYDDGLTPTKIYSYDQATGWGGNSLGYSKGSLTTAHASLGSTWMETQFAYDLSGRVIQTGQCLPDWCGNPAHDTWRWYGYDLADRIRQETYNTSVGTYSVNYGINVAGQLDSVTGGQNDSLNAGAIYKAVTVMPAGATGIDFGNGLKGMNRFDANGKNSATYVCVGSYSVDCAGGSEVYGFASNPVGGQVNWRCDTVVGLCNDYNYDEFGRLVHSSSGGIATSDSTFDRYGNRWQQSSYNGGLSTSLSFDTSNNHINSPGYTYDAAGNMVQDPNHSYQYDADGNLLSIDGGATASYMYDAMNQRVKTADIRGIYRYGFDLSSRRATIWYDNGATALSQYYADGSPIAYWLAMDGHIHYQHQDNLGTERVRTNNLGSAVEASFKSGEFGENYSTPNTDTNPAHFAGTDHDLGQGAFTVEHAKAREYAPSHGRWMSPDPSSGSYRMANPQTFNRYVYAGNNPLSNTDPSGLDYCSGWNSSTSYDPVTGTWSTPTEPTDPGSCAAQGGQWLPDDPNQAPHVDQSVDVVDQDSLLYAQGWGLGWTADSVYDWPTSNSDADVIYQLAVGINNRAGWIGTPQGVAGFYGASAVGAGVALGVAYLVPAAEMTVFEIPEYEWELNLIKNDNPSMLKPDLYHVAGRLMAKNVIQYGTVAKIGNYVGYASPYVEFALQSTLNGVAGEFQVGGHFVSALDFLVTHSAFSAFVP